MDEESSPTLNKLFEKKLTPENLHKNGIRFQKQVGKPAANIASLRAELLDFSNVVTADDAEIADSSHLSADSEKAHRRAEHVRLISEEAKDMREGEEDLWVAFIKREIFCGWGSSRKPKRPIDYFSLTGCVARNGPSVQWIEAARYRNCPAKDVLTAPKPDIYFGIQIYESLPEPSGFLNQALQNFTFDALDSCQDLHYSPSKKPTGEYHKHQVCFPFTIVEVKHANVSVTERQHCFCQAVNAASAALAMLCSLNRHNPNVQYWHADKHMILPIVTFTFIGYKVRVWLAYISYFACVEDRDPHMHRYRMNCIWIGDIRKVRKAAELCSIIDKVAEWFFYIYRPWISTCLDQWKAPDAEKRLKEAHKSFLNSMPRSGFGHLLSRPRSTEDILERPSAGGSSGSPASKVKGSPATRRTMSLSSQPTERPSTGGTDSPAPKSNEKPASGRSPWFTPLLKSCPPTGGVTSPPPKSNERLLARSGRNVFAPETAELPYRSKLSAGVPPSLWSKAKRKPSNSRRSASTPAGDIATPSASYTLDSDSSEDEEPFDRSGACSIGRDKYGNPGSEAARAGYSYRTR